MKYFFTLLALWAVFIYACKKEPIGYGKDTGCNCGTIVEDDVETATQCYWLMVENECSGNQKKFCVDPLIWSTYPVGDRICINDVKSW